MPALFLLIPVRIEFHAALGAFKTIALGALKTSLCGPGGFGGALGGEPGERIGWGGLGGALARLMAGTESAGDAFKRFGHSCDGFEVRQDIPDEIRNLNHTRIESNSGWPACPGNSRDEIQGRDTCVLGQFKDIALGALKTSLFGPGGFGGGGAGGGGIAGSLFGSLPGGLFGAATKQAGGGVMTVGGGPVRV